MNDYACPYCPASFAWGKDKNSHLGIAAAGPTCGENAYWKLAGHIAAEHPAEGFTCGRRGDNLFQPTTKCQDHWIKRDGRSCSYCGSMHPEDLFAAIEAGTCQISGTDKSYKVYVQSGGRHLKFYYQHFTAEQQDRFIALYNSRKLPLEPKFGLYVTPYFATRAPAPG